MHNLDILKYHKTAVDSNNNCREYILHRKEGEFEVLCYEWKSEQGIDSGPKLLYSDGFDDEKIAIEKYNDLFSVWELWEPK